MKKVERTAEQFRTECLEGLRRAEALRPQIVTSSARTIDEALDHYNAAADRREREQRARRA